MMKNCGQSSSKSGLVLELSISVGKVDELK